MEKREFLKICTCALGATALGGFMKDVHAFTPSSLPSPNPDKLWKWSCEVPYFEVVSNGIKCLVCPNECIIHENGSGSQCRTRVIYEGKLYTISYGNPCAVHVDPIEKKPLFHFLPPPPASRSQLQAATSPA